LGGDLAGQELVWIDDIANHPLRVEERGRKVYDGAGGLVEVTDSEDILPDEYARLLFRMSSRLPDHMGGEAHRVGYDISDAAHGFTFNARETDVIQFLEIGTRGPETESMR